MNGPTNPQPAHHPRLAGRRRRPGRGPIWGIAALGELADIFVLFAQVSCVTLVSCLPVQSRASTVWFVWFVQDVCVNIWMFT
jgi:hypothetical protein